MVKTLVLLALLPLSGFADMISPSHNCLRPARPSQFATDAEEASYQRNIGTYKRCLSDFINEQNKEARFHSEAARNATNDLNRVGS